MCLADSSLEDDMELPVAKGTLDQSEEDLESDSEGVVVTPAPRALSAMAVSNTGF